MAGRETGEAPLLASLTNCSQGVRKKDRSIRSERADSAAQQPGLNNGMCAGCRHPRSAVRERPKPTPRGQALLVLALASPPPLCFAAAQGRARSIVCRTERVARERRQNSEAHTAGGLRRIQASSRIDPPSKRHRVAPNNALLGSQRKGRRPAVTPKKKERRKKKTRKKIFVSGV
jgi:hypothetical protein